MGGKAPRTLQYTPVLYIADDEPDSRAALQLLKDFDVDVKVIHLLPNDKDDETITPWLVTQNSNHYGLTNIRYYINQERKFAQQRATSG